MRATTEELEDFKVKLRVEIDDADAADALNEATKAIARAARLPGFRPGKVPVKVLEARLGGPGALRSEAVREALPTFYSQALAEVAIDAIDQGEIDLVDDANDMVVFEATVPVRPVVELGTLSDLEVVIATPLVDDAEVEAQVERLRSADGELEEVDRPIETGDFVTLDLGSKVGEADEENLTEDVLYEVGTGQVVPELDELLVGKAQGEEFEFDTTPATTGVEMHLRVVVKAVKVRQLPPLTDEWVEENTEFDSVAALRDSLFERLRPMKLAQAKMAFADAIRAQLVDQVDDRYCVEPLVSAELNERAQSFSRRMAEQGISLEQYLAITGQSNEQLIADLQADAQRMVKYDLALRAVVAQQGIVATEEDLERELERSAAPLGVDVDTLRTQIEAVGRMAEFTSEVAKSLALEWLRSTVVAKDEHGAVIDAALLADDALDDHDHDHDHDHDDDVEEDGAQ